MLAGLALALFGFAATPEAPPSLTLESVQIKGVAVTRRPAMRARLDLDRGEPFDEARVQEARVDLLSTGLFQSVDVHLEKGSERGRVQVVFDCVERTTTSIEALHLGHARPTNLWGGLEVADLDPFGLGFSLDAGFVASGDQGALVLGGGPREVAGTPLELHLRTHLLIGNEPFVGPLSQRLDGVGTVDVRAPYRRAGATIRAALPFGEYARLLAASGLEDVRFDAPSGAEQLDPDGVWRPFEFGGAEGVLFHGALGLEYDSRNDPSFPSRGLRASLRGKAGHISGDTFFSVLTGLEQYLRLPFGHVIRLDLKAGALFGQAPFFERWFIGDLHPYVPERSLGLNFARRRGPNLIDGPITEQRYETMAARVGFEYRVPLSVRSNTSVGVEFFIGSAVVSLGTPGESNGPAIDPDRGSPIDLAIDAGLRIESEIGVMGLSLGNLFLLVDP